MSEQDRFNFLASRDGIEAAKAWEIQAAIYYRRAAEAALQPRKIEEAKCIARGKEWASMYFAAAAECEQFSE